MKKLREYIQKSYRRELLFTFVTGSALIVLITGLLLVNLFWHRTNRQFEEKDSAQGEEIGITLSDELRRVDDALNSLASDLVIGSAWSAFSASGSGGDSVSSPENEAGEEIYSTLYRCTDSVRSCASIDLYASGTCVYSTVRGNVGLMMPLYFGILKHASESRGETVWETGYSPLDPSEVSLQAARELKEDSSFFAVVTIASDGFDSLLQASAGSGTVAVLDSFWQPVYRRGYLGTSAVLQTLRDNLLAGKEPGDGLDFHVCAVPLSAAPSGRTGFTLLYLTPPALSRTLYQNMVQTILIIMGIVMAAAVLISLLLARFLAKPVQTMSSAMRSLRHGNLHAQITVRRDDEFGELYDGFNRTVVQLQHMMDEQARRQKELNDTRIRMVQAQLNPHFLYNTLDTIKWVAKEHDIPEIASLSTHLARLLRQSITEAEFVPLSDELDLLEDYCEIQEFRFDDQFGYEFEVPPELMNCQVPKLILQPVVENAIIHGLQGVPDGLVVVKAETETLQNDENNQNNESIENSRTKDRCKNMLRITVTDNGRGIPDEILDRINRHQTGELSGHLGLYNVDTIIRLHYGGAYGLEAQRDPQGGSIVTVCLPAVLIREGGSHGT